jgi:hypothetical protein
MAKSTPEEVVLRPRCTEGAPMKCWRRHHPAGQAGLSAEPGVYRMLSNAE